MKIARFSSPTGPRLGVLDGERLIDLVRAAEEHNLEWMRPVFSDLRVFFATGTEGRETARWLAGRSAARAQSVASVKLLAPVEASSRILAHVVNYAEHGKEGGLTPPERPFFFWKHTSTVVGHGDPIVGHALSPKIDYEVELAVVIGRRGRDIPEAHAYDYVAGYTICNDVSFRDFQVNEAARSLTPRYGQNWVQGKALDRSCPLGPAIALTDEIPDPYPLDIVLRVNGRERQRDTTASMIFRVPQLIADISRGMTLVPGDVISTGTPSGSAIATGEWLAHGDLVECEIPPIGKLVNRVETR